MDPGFPQSIYSSGVVFVACRYWERRKRKVFTSLPSIQPWHRIGQPGLSGGLAIRKGSDLSLPTRAGKISSFINRRSSPMVFEASAKGRRWSSRSRLGKMGGQRPWRLLGLTDLPFREARETATVAAEAAGEAGPGAGLGPGMGPGGEVIGVVMVVVVVRLVIIVVEPGT